jgi:hypothetical protein
MLRFIGNRDGHVDFLRKVNSIQKEIKDSVPADLIHSILMYAITPNRSLEYMRAAVREDNLEALVGLRENWNFEVKTILKDAATNGSIQILKYAIENCDTTNEDIGEALIYAARAKRYKATLLLLEKNPSCAAISKAALCALLKENTRISEILEKSGADIFFDRGSVFREACARGQFLTVEYYLSRVSNEREMRVILGGEYGEITALEEAARNGHIIIVRLIFRAADRFEIADDYVFDTLYGAQEAGYEDIAEYIHVSISEGIF